jgi:predicted nucleotidyltransferase
LETRTGVPKHRDHEFVSEKLLNRTQALQLLAQHKAVLTQRFGVTDLALLGSIARDTARPDSDVDILVAFDGPATSARYFGVQFYLEDLPGCPVDLVTDKALRPQLRPYIEKEAVHV